MLKKVFPLIALTTALVWAACSAADTREGVGSSSEPLAAVPTNSAVLSSYDQVSIMGDADYSPLYRSFSDLVRAYPTVVTGTVGTVLLPFDPRPGYKGLTVDQVVGSSPKSSWTPSAEEMNRPPGRDYSVYSIKLTGIIRSDTLKVGDSIAVLQSGGVFDQIAYQIEDDPVIEPGVEYLFFLDEFKGLSDISVEQPWGTTYSGPPYGRFVVNNGKLQVVSDAWLCEPCEGPRTIADTSVEVAASRVEAARSGTMEKIDLAPAVTPAPVPTDVPVLPVITDQAGKPTIVATPAVVVSPTPRDPVPRHGAGTQ